MANEPIDTLVKASGLSRRAFARQYGVGEQVLLRLSQGRFTRVPASILQAIREAYPDVRDVHGLLYEQFGTQDVEEAYEIWRAARQPEGRLPTTEELQAQDSALSPAQRLAAAVGSMSKLAAVLHVHDYVVRRYVNGQTRELPASMRESMEKLGWPHAEHLDRAQQNWLWERDL